MEKETKVYQILYNSILTQIYTNHLKKGDVLPSLKEICTRYNLGISTVRKAIALLQENHYIATSKGKKAVVIYDTANQEHIQKSYESIVMRTASILDTYDALILLLPNLIVKSTAYFPQKKYHELIRLVPDQAGTPLSTEQTLEITELFFYRIFSVMNNSLLTNLYIQANQFIKTPFINGVSYDSPAKTIDSPHHYLKNIVDFMEKEDYVSLKTQITKICQLIKGDAAKYLQALSSQYPVKDSVSFYWLIPRERAPLYGEITKFIMEDITTGHYKNGEFLPSISTLSKKYNISEITARSSIALLNSLGLTKTMNGKGTQVLPTTHIDGKQRLQNPFIQRSLLQLLQSLQIVAITSEPLLSYAIAFLNKENLIKIKKTIHDSKENSTPNNFFSQFVLLRELLEIIPNDVLRNIYKQLFEFITWGRYLQFLQDKNTMLIEQVYQKDLEVLELFYQENYASFIQMACEQTNHLYQIVKTNLVELKLDQALKFPDLQP